MKTLLTYLMVFGGSALMAYNIYCYIRFYKHIRMRSNWEHEGRIFYIPILLLVLFLMGYLVVGLFGHPDFVMAGILLGGSIFVFVMLLVIRHAADRIQENERLEARLSAAEEASRAKTFFLSNMSHDIRTPLNAIIGYTTLANQNDLSLEETAEYIKKIETAGHQLLDIVNDVLEMSRIESGKLELESIPFDLQKCVDDAGDLVKPQLSEKEIDFAVSCDISHSHVLGDRNQLNRALMNLLCNAVKFTEKGGSVELALREIPGDGEIRNYEIYIKDTGIGMSNEFVENLFTPFERERTSTVSRIQGTGLGMAITKNIIDMMGGMIEVDTKQGEGTEFTIYISFPILDEEVDVDSDADGEIRFDGCRALLVEDNAVNLEIAKTLLVQAGFIIETAMDGKQAVDIVAASEAGDFDVILMDVQMPIMNGYDATKAIRSLADKDISTTPIIAMTANAFQDDIHAAENAGMDGHIAKPVDIQKMKQTIQKVLRK